MTLLLTVGALASVVSKFVSEVANCGIFVIEVCTLLLPSFAMFLATSPICAAFSDTAVNWLNALAVELSELATVLSAELSTLAILVMFLASLVKLAVPTSVIALIEVLRLVTFIDNVLSSEPLTRPSDVARLPSLIMRLSIAVFAFWAVACNPISKLSTSAILSPPRHKNKSGTDYSVPPLSLLLRSKLSCIPISCVSNSCLFRSASRSCSTGSCATYIACSGYSTLSLPHAPPLVPMMIAGKPYCLVHSHTSLSRSLRLSFSPSRQ